MGSKMGEVSANTVAQWVVSDAKNTEFRPLLDVLSDALSARLPGKSLEDRAELAEDLLQRVVTSLETVVAELREDGVEPAFELSADEKTNYFKALETAAVRFVDGLLRLSPKEFEGFCASVLERMGGTSFVTGQPGDGGVDFVGRDVRFYGDAGPSPVGARVLVVGQAKRYAKGSLIPENELRTFIGGAIRKVSDPHSDTFKSGVLAPVVFAFWTTADFHPSAKRYAKAVGLWYLNGLALAQLAIRVGIKVD